MICETDKDDCIVCLLVDRGRSEGGIYFAGVIHGLHGQHLDLPFCALHHASWTSVLSKWKQEAASLPGVQ